ncbi:MAG: hypothetical protein ABJG41_01005 [Cyclobacteriaceae bacterium]
MKWKNTLNATRNESLMLVSIVALIIIIAYMHKKQVSSLENTVIEIYEDRLVAKGYIFELTKKINAKKTSLNFETNNVEDDVIANHAISRLIESYGQTNLTNEEVAGLNKLRENIGLSAEFETQMVKDMPLAERIKIKESLSRQYDVVLSDLEGLSEIQLFEGKKLLESTDQIVASNVLTNRLELALIVVVSLVFLVILSPKAAGIKKKILHT